MRKWMSGEFVLHSLQRAQKLQHCTMNLKENKDQVFNFVKLHVKGVTCKSEKSPGVVLESLDLALQMAWPRANRLTFLAYRGCPPL